jgi:hypothetical protein
MRQALVCGRAFVAALSLVATHGAAAQSLRVAPTPTVRIGATDEASALLNAVAGATRLPNGQIVVGNRGDYALLVFDAKGTLVKKAARKGKGPGEVDYLLWLKRCGSTIYTGDIEANRVQAFTPAFALARAFRFADQTYRLDCNADGRFVHMGWEPSSAFKAGPFRATTRYWITGADSAMGVTIGMLPGSERFGTTTPDGRPTGTGPLVLGKESRLAIGSQAAYVATADSLTVLAFGLDGTPRPALRAPYTPVPSSDADVEAEIERRVAALGEAARKRTTADLRAMPRPKSLPATRDVLVDATDLVWVQSYPSAKQSTVAWTVFRPNGTVAARLSLPSALDVFEIGRDYLLGQVLNPDTGVPEVHLYTVTR